jgi:hypothetical protein
LIRRTGSGQGIPFLVELVRVTLRTPTSALDQEGDAPVRQSVLRAPHLESSGSFFFYTLDAFV